MNLWSAKTASVVILIGMLVGFPKPCLAEKKAAEFYAGPLSAVAETIAEEAKTRLSADAKPEFTTEALTQEAALENEISGNTSSVKKSY